MRYIVPMVIFGIIGLTVIIIFVINTLKDRWIGKVKAVQKSRNLYRSQLDIAVEALQTEKALGSSGAELALIDIDKLQRKYEEQKELSI